MKDFPAQFDELNTWMETLGITMPGVMKSFGSLHDASLKQGALKAGASKDEIAETVSVAILMGGSPSVVMASRRCRHSASMLNTEYNCTPVLE